MLAFSVSGAVSSGTKPLYSHSEGTNVGNMNIYEVR